MNWEKLFSAASLFWFIAIGAVGSAALAVPWLMGIVGFFELPELAIYHFSIIVPMVGSLVVGICAGLLIKPTWLRERAPRIGMVSLTALFVGAVLFDKFTLAHDERLYCSPFVNPPHSAWETTLGEGPIPVGWDIPLDFAGKAQSGQIPLMACSSECIDFLFAHPSSSLLAQNFGSMLGINVPHQSNADLPQVYYLTTGASGCVLDVPTLDRAVEVASAEGEGGLFALDHMRRLRDKVKAGACIRERSGRPDEVVELTYSATTRTALYTHFEHHEFRFTRSSHHLILRELVMGTPVSEGLAGGQVLGCNDTGISNFLSTVTEGRT